MGERALATRSVSSMSQLHIAQFLLHFSGPQAAEEREEIIRQIERTGEELKRAGKCSQWFHGTLARRTPRPRGKYVGIFVDALVTSWVYCKKFQHGEISVGIRIRATP